MRPVLEIWFEKNKVHPVTGPGALIDCNGFPVYCELDVIELVQFTGLYDKNGKEIYEGDIIKSDGSYPLEIFWMGIAWGLRWKDNGSLEEEIISDDGGDMEMGEKCLKYMEVIGNIYENPELLK